MMNNKIAKFVILFAPIIMVKAPDLVRDFSDSAEPACALNSSVEEVGRSLEFKIDTARLTVALHTSLKNITVQVLSLSDECYSCSPYLIGKLEKHHMNKTFLVDTRWPTSINLMVNETDCNNTFHYSFGERGEYSVNFTVNLQSSKYNCSLSKVHVQTDPWNSSMPIFYAFLILLALVILYSVACYLYRRRRSSSTSELVTENLGNPNTEMSGPGIQYEGSLNQESPRPRLKSIDTFRGLCIVIMIFVNYKGGYYWFFRHSPWNGLTVADLVFPWFMFIMGVNITLSIDSLLRRNTPAKMIAYKVVRRTLILFALGITIINHNTEWQTLRVPGVLQRFAIAYLFGFLTQWGFHVSASRFEEKLTRDEDRLVWWHSIGDIVLYWKQWIVVLLLEAVWLLLTFLLPVPGCPKGYLGPGGLAENGKYMYKDCIGGAAGYIDRRIFGEAHIYGHPTAKSIYYPMKSHEATVPYDPEGLLGSINGCIIVFLGSQMGKIFLYYRSTRGRCVRWLGWSIFLGVISIILCKASLNEGWIPINKNLWSITFVTSLSSMAFFLMIIIYFLVDVWKVWSGSPLDFVGMNSILLYVGHEVFQDFLPFSWGATQYSTHAEWLAMNMLGVFYWVIIAYYCYKIEFFVKI